MFGPETPIENRFSLGAWTTLAKSFWLLAPTRIGQTNPLPGRQDRQAEQSPPAKGLFKLGIARPFGTLPKEQSRLITLFNATARIIGMV